MSQSFFAQPWLYAGLSTLLLPSADRAQELRAPAASPVAASPPRQRQAPARPAPASRPAPREESAPANAEPLPLPPQDWSAPWRELLQGRKWPPKPVVLWTYAGLGHDLSGQPVLERRDVVASLLQGLGHVPGTHVFWPYALPDDTADPKTMFRSGVELFQPRVLVVLGSEARDTLDLPRITPYQYDLAFGRRLFMLPQPAGLHGRPEALQSALAYLGENLRFCPRKNA